VVELFLLRYFSVEEYGIFSLIAATIIFVTPITELGLPKAVLRLFSEFHSSLDTKIVKGIISLFQYPKTHTFLFYKQKRPAEYQAVLL